MAHAYTPGLQVMERTLFRAVRVLPIPGDVQRQVGERVSAQDIVAETLLPGDVFPINLSNQLGLVPAEVPRSLTKVIGDTVDVGEVLAVATGLFGMFRTEYLSKHAGTIESVSSITGQMILRGPQIPVRVLAYTTGTVVEVLPREGVVVESEAALIQGIFGVGGETYGNLCLVCSRPDQDLTPDLIQVAHQGRIVVGGRRISGAAIRRAAELGVSAVVGGGIDDQDLKDILGYDLGVAITGTEQNGVTVIVTEGFGEIAMADRTFAILKSHDGAPAAVNGATQIRAGVIRPEIVIPLSNRSQTDKVAATVGGGVLDLGSLVRIIRDPYFGVLGAVCDLPQEPQLLATGSKARVLEVQTGDGRRLTVPRANVEIVSA